LLAAELCIEIEKLNVWRNQQMEVHPLWAMYPPQFPRAPVVVCRMVGGEHFATTPFGVLLEGSAECQPGEGIAAMRSAVEGTLAEFAHSRGLRMGEQVSLEWWGMHADPTVTDPGHPIVETLAACSEAVLGHPSMRVGAGGCDMFRFGSVQVPSVMYGAAGDNGHGIDEWVDIDSLLQTIKVVFLTTLCWCGRGETLTQALTNPAAGARTPSGSTPAA